MFKPPGNPAVLILNTKHTKRRINLSALKVITIDGVRYCAWCAAGKLKGSKRQKYCSDECRLSVTAWGDPQKEEGLAVLLARQGYLCHLCGYDWNFLADSLLGKYGIAKKLNRLVTFNHKLLKIIKNRAEEGRKPEVDHIIPIFKGGQSIGLENHQAICAICHRKKTSADRKKLPTI